MGQRLEGKITAIEVRSAYTEKYDRFGKVIASSDLGNVVYITIESPEGQKTVPYYGSEILSEMVCGHSVIIEEEEIITLRRKAGGNLLTNFSPPNPTKITIYDCTLGRWYS